MGVFKNDAIGKFKIDKLPIESVKKEARRFKQKSPAKKTVFVPDIKNAELIRQRMEKLEQERYDEKSMLVKLCIQDGGLINSNELMRFHPFFS